MKLAQIRSFYNSTHNNKYVRLQDACLLPARRNSSHRVEAHNGTLATVALFVMPAVENNFPVLGTIEREALVLHQVSRGFLCLHCGECLPVISLALRAGFCLTGCGRGGLTDNNFVNRSAGSDFRLRPCDSNRHNN